MKQSLIALTIVALLSGCTKQECELCGHWRSDAERTLTEMEKSSVLSDKQRRFFRNDFYGHLIVETRENDGRAYFPDQAPDSVPWEPWEVVMRSDESLTVRYSMGGKTFERSIMIDEDCYRVEQPELGFGEWFCRVL